MHSLFIVLFILGHGEKLDSQPAVTLPQSTAIKTLSLESKPERKRLVFTATIYTEKVELAFNSQDTFVVGKCYYEIFALRLCLLLAERALSRDYIVKMWSSKTLYLTASRAEGDYSGLMHGLE